MTSECAIISLVGYEKNISENQCTWKHLRRGLGENISFFPFFTKKREVYRKWSIKRRFSNKRCSQISAAVQIWFTNKRPTFVTALDIKTISLDKQDPHPLVSSKVLMYGNFRNQVHITVRGVHIYPFSCPTLRSLFIPLSVLPLVEISAAPLTWKMK